METKIKCGHCSTRTLAVYHRNKHEVFMCARTRSQMSQLANARTAPVQTGQRPNEWRIKTPRPMVENMREGRYAVPHPGTTGDDASQHTFIRVWRPQSGKRKGQLVIRTQHSDDYRDFITFYPSGSFWFAKANDTLDQCLMMIAADPYTAAMTYARIHKVCSSCGKKLTDNRSRWYGIGPECEKKWPEIINRVNDTKGPFVAS